MIKTKSIHDPIEYSDGQRILISCYWPKFATLKIVDLWLPELGSDLELIKNWNGRKYDWDFFKNDYLIKLESSKVEHILKRVAETAKESNVTLIGHARASNQCHRTLLKDYLDQHYIYSVQR